MGLPTIVSQRSGLFYAQQRGGLPVIQDTHVYTGNVFFVMTGGSDVAGVGQHPDSPFATTDFAIGQCTANQGDTIFVMPGHTETISGAAGITCDVAGVSIIGLGHGAARPTITFSATGSTWVISAADVVLENMIVTCTAATTKMFDHSGANTRLHKIDYTQGSGIPLQFILTTSASDDLDISGCYHKGTTAGASAQLWIRLIGCANPRILDNVIIMTLENGATDACISGDGSVVDFLIARNIILQTGGSTQVSGVLMTDGATGFAVYNTVVVASAGTLAGIMGVGNAAYAAENYVLDTVEKSGKLDPVVDA